MKIIFFLSHCCVINNEQWLFRVFHLFTRWDWLRSLTRLRFYHLTCLRFSAELFLFVIFSTFSFVLVQLFFIHRSSSRSSRNHYLTLLLFSNYSKSFSDRFRFWDSADQDDFWFNFRVRHKWSITEHNFHNCCCLVERADNWRTY